MDTNNNPNSRSIYFVLEVVVVRLFLVSNVRDAVIARVCIRKMSQSVKVVQAKCRRCFKPKEGSDVGVLLMGMKW